MANKRNKSRQNTFDKNNLELETIVPLTDNQKLVFDSEKHQVLHGCAGTGKTFISSYMAFELIKRGKFDKLIYVRSAVATRNLGFYPGDPSEKVKEFESPYINIATDLFGRADAYSCLKNCGTIEFMSTSHLRGVTLRNAIIIADEVQNMTYHELDTIMTRPDDDCRLFFCGDFEQADIKDSGIKDFYKVLKSMEQFNFVDFQEDDIVRGGLVKAYLIAKAKLKRNESTAK